MEITGSSPRTGHVVRCEVLKRLTLPSFKMFSKKKMSTKVHFEKRNFLVGFGI